MFEFKACEVFKTKEFTFVNDCFKDEHNAEIGHYGQTLIDLIHLFHNYLSIKQINYPVGITCIAVAMCYHDYGGTLLVQFR